MPRSAATTSPPSAPITAHSDRASAAATAVTSATASNTASATIAAGSATIATATGGGPASTASPASAGPANPAAPTVFDQVVTVLAPLQPAAGGMHTVSLGLQPEGLGTVQATVSAGAQQIVVSLWAATSDGHAALSQALSQLHSHLAEDPTRSVTVELAPFGSQQLGSQAGQHGASSPQPRPVSADVSSPAPIDSAIPESIGAAPAGLRATTIDLHL